MDKASLEPTHIPAPSSPIPIPSIFAQLRILVRRNHWLKRRNKRQVFAEILFPLVFILPLIAINGLSKPQYYEEVRGFPRLETGLVLGQNGLGSVLGYAPGGPLFDTIVAETKGFLSEFGNITTQAFPSESALEDFYARNPTALYAGLIFDSPTSYTIRYNASALPSNSVPDRIQCRSTASFRSGCATDKYVTSGLLTLQAAVDSAIIHRISGSPITIRPYTLQMPLPAANLSPSSQSDGGATQTAIYITIAFSPFLTSLLFNLVTEKEKKIKEGMLMMGLHPVAFWLSWAVTYAGTLLVVVLLITAVIHFASILPQSNFLLLVIIYYVYTLSLVALAFALTTFFSKAKMATVVGPFLSIVPGVLFIPIRSANLSAGPSVLLSMLLSPMALSLTMDKTVSLETSGTGLQFSNLSSSGANYYVLGLALAVPFYFLLALYLDAVIPSEYGIRKPWYFPFVALVRPHRYSLMASRASSLGVVMHAEDDPRDTGEQDVEAESHGAFKAIEIRDLRKVYHPGVKKGTNKEKVAVRGLSLGIFEGEIFGLLGHNGAGKSTTIHMLCGLYPPTSGTALMYNHDIQTNMRQIRQMIGVCPQHDILYDELTVEEHLRIFAGLKGVGITTDENVDTRIDQVLSDVDLVDKKTARAKELSGGQKRKLSVGIALIGRPKILLLDEPTSGMDPYSRRKIWDLLSSSKHTRCTLLSTHFMDEADILADRKAILSRGRLQCLGTSLFLKKRFGIGYHLDIVHSAPATQPVRLAVRELLQTHLADAPITYPPDVNETTNSQWEIPSNRVKSFPAFFKDLDRVAPTVGIESYGVSMPTLEQVFLKSAEMEEMERRAAEEEVDMDERHVGGPLPDLQETDKQPVTFRTLFTATLHIRYKLYFREIRALIYAVIIPIAMLLAGLLIAPSGDMTGTVSGTTPTTLDTPTLFFDPAGNASNANVIASSISPPVQTISGDWQDWVLTNPPHQGGFALSSLSTTLVPTLYYNTSTPSTTLPSTAHTLSNAILSQTTSTRITTSIKPLPNLSRVPWDSRSYVSILLIALALGMPAGANGIAIVGEREAKIVYLGHVMGLTRGVYWGAAFVCDLSLFMILPVIIIICIWAIPLTAFTGPAFPIVFISLVIALPSALLFSYFLSLLFKTQDTARTVLGSGLSLFTLFPYILVSLLDVLVSRSAAKICHYVFAVLDPYYPIAGILYYTNMEGLIHNIVPGAPPLTVSDYFGFDKNMFPTVLIAFVQLGVAACGIYVLDFWRTRVRNVQPWDPALKRTLESQRHDSTDPNERDDVDVIAERRRVNDQVTSLPHSYDIESPPITDEILLHDIRKTYHAKTAVEWTSWGVSKGHLFTLLGPNGAGKTTTLAIAIGSTPPTHGTVYIHHTSIYTSTTPFHHVGYCPQFDALWPHITVSEHLTYYATLKGLTPSAIPPRIQHLTRALGLTEFLSKPAGQLSGGNKRKLSLAVSIVGDPSALFLDEPSTGMDPASKRLLWDVLKSGHRATVLTTHSMEEAETLSTRLAIQISGRLVCIGTPQHLKTRFSSGYHLEITSTSPPPLSHIFPNAQLIESFGTMYRYTVPKTDVQAFGSLGEVFGVLLGVGEFVFCQSMLEQVFIGFAKGQV
ncbi:hypothetical protein SpCBS45565_g08461 [Spizellomyces sp. 'palustris']|nr:hypothetical protein SpCBS45565_g08461 [Spizellomyces sp. 'palustris']